MRIGLDDLFASIPPHTNDSFARVMRCSWSVLGGPDEALLTLPEEGVGLEAYQHLLGQSVEIFDGSGSKVWWGYISALRIPKAPLPQEMDLEAMANRVSAIFEEMEPGSEPGLNRQTAWVEAPQSQAVYGVKEKILRLGMVSLAQANQSAARFLTDHAWPIVASTGHSLDVFRGGSDRSRHSPPAGAIEVVCKGWISRLGWRCWQTKSGTLGHSPVQVGVQKIGDLAATQRLAQSFKVDLTQDVSYIKLRLRKEGSPADALTISIQSDSSGLPSGTALATASVSASAVSAEGYGWCQVSFSPAPKLTAGVTYWLVAQRSGALNPSAYYLAGLDESAGYLGGVLRVYNSSTSLWSPRAPAADLLFRFGLIKASDELIRELFDAVGQDLSGLQIEAQTGFTLAPFFREPMDGLSVLRKLLDLGASDLSPFIAEVNPVKLLRVAARPEAKPAALLVDQSGNLCDRFGNLVDLDRLPTGNWVQIGDSQPVFIQKATWEAGKTRLTLHY